MEEPIFSDIFTGVLHHIPEEARRFKFDEEDLQLFIYERRGKYSILSHIPIDEDGIRPSSKEVFDGYWSLLVTSNMDYCTNGMIYAGGAVDVSYNNWIEKKLTEEQKSDLEELAKEFQEKFSMVELSQSIS